MAGVVSITIENSVVGKMSNVGKFFKISPEVRKWSKFNVPLFPNIPQQFPCSPSYLKISLVL